MTLDNPANTITTPQLQLTPDPMAPNGGNVLLSLTTPPDVGDRLAITLSFVAEGTQTLTLPDAQTITYTSAPSEDVFLQFYFFNGTYIAGLHRAGDHLAQLQGRLVSGSVPLTFNFPGIIFKGYVLLRTNGQPVIEQLAERTT